MTASVNPDRRISVPVIVGPTAVGKSDVAVSLAERINGEIISADSRQIYRGLEIGTAKPSKSDQNKIRHHLIDELDIAEHYSAGIFSNMAEERIQAIHDCGRIPIVTGGSTLYIEALVKGLADIPATDPVIRDELNARLEREGGAVLYRELLERDPEFAATLDETKTQRIVRGLEVAIGTERPLSTYFKSDRDQGHRFLLFVLHRNRDLLYRRINERVDAMMDAGFLNEVESLLEAWPDSRFAVLKTIGYRELTLHLRGDIALGAAVDLIKRNTRRYAKRQLTWFRRYVDAHWFDVDEEPQLVSTIARFFGIETS